MIHRARVGFTLLELLVVIVVTGALGTLVATLGNRMAARSRAVNCSQNLRQIGLAAMAYAGDHHMTLPVTTHQRSKGGKSWTITLQPYTATVLTFKCHEDKNTARTYTYVLNDLLTPNPADAPDLNYSILAKIEQPQSTFFFAEAAPDYANSDHFHFAGYHGGEVPAEAFQTQVAVEGHAGKANYLFADGHVETLPWAEVKTRLSSHHSPFVDPSMGQSNAN